MDNVTDQQIEAGMTRNSVEMGWGSRPMKEQHPILPDDNADHFDQDNEAISRLLLRGLLTQSQAAAARKKYVSKVSDAIRQALAAKGDSRG